MPAGPRAAVLDAMAGGVVFKEQLGCFVRASTWVICWESRSTVWTEVWYYVSILEGREKMVETVCRVWGIDDPISVEPIDSVFILWML